MTSPWPGATPTSPANPVVAGRWNVASPTSSWIAAKSNPPRAAKPWAQFAPTSSPQSVNVGRATRTASARTIALPPGQTINVGRATRTASARPLTAMVSQTINVGRATRTASARTITAPPPTWTASFAPGQALPAGLWTRSPVQGAVVQVSDVKPTGSTGSLKLGSPGSSLASEASVTVTCAASGALTFKFSTSSEGNYDRLYCYVDGSAVAFNGAATTASGVTGWTDSTSISLSAGTHTILWQYQKDGSLDVGADCVWIADVAITNVTKDASTSTYGGALDFEDGAMPSSISSTDWTNSTSNPISGTRSLRSPASPAHGGVYDATVTVPGTGVRTVEFDWKVAAEAGYDFLDILVGGSVVLSLKNQTSAVSGYGTASVVIPAGQTGFVARYHKDGSASALDDAAWLDRMLLPSTGSASPTINVGRATGVTTARTMISTQTVHVGRATCTATARAITPGSGRLFSVGRATRSAVAQPLSPAAGVRSVAVGRATRSALARPVTLGGTIKFLGRATRSAVGRVATVLPSVVYVASTTNLHSGTDRSSLSLTIPSSAQVGDILVLVVASRPWVTYPPDWYIPGGEHGQGILESGTNSVVDLMVKQVVAGDPGSVLTLTLSAAGAASASLAVYRGAATFPTDTFFSDSQDAYLWTSDRSTVTGGGAGIGAGYQGRVISVFGGIQRTTSSQTPTVDSGLTMRSTTPQSNVEVGLADAGPSVGGVVPTWDAKTLGRYWTASIHLQPGIPGLFKVVNRATRTPTARPVHAMYPQWIGVGKVTRTATARPIPDPPLIEWVRGAFVSSTTQTLTTEHVGPAHVAILAVHFPSGMRTVSTVAGIGGTWTRVLGPADTSTKGRTEVWIGTNLTGPGDITTTLTSFGAFMTEVHVVGGVNQAQILSSWANLLDSADGTSSVSTTARDGQFVLYYGLLGNGLFGTSIITGGGGTTPSDHWHDHPVLHSGPGGYDEVSSWRIVTNPEAPEHQQLTHAGSMTSTGGAAFKSQTILTVGIGSPFPQTVALGRAASLHQAKRFTRVGSYSQEISVGLATGTHTGRSLTVQVPTVPDPSGPPDTWFEIPAARVFPHVQPGHHDWDTAIDADTGDYLAHHVVLLTQECGSSGPYECGAPQVVSQFDLSWASIAHYTPPEGGSDGCRLYLEFPPTELPEGATGEVYLLIRGETDINPVPGGIKLKAEYNDGASTLTGVIPKLTGSATVDDQTPVYTPLPGVTFDDVRQGRVNVTSKLPSAPDYDFEGGDALWLETPPYGTEWNNKYSGNFTIVNYVALAVKLADTVGVLKIKIAGDVELGIPDNWVRVY